jgi:salicylate hydroxylase
MQPSSLELPVNLFFSDSTEAECDLLIGADGLRSVVRSCMMEELAAAAEKEQRLTEAEILRSCKDVQWSGHLVYRAIIPREKVEEVAPDHLALGKSPLIVMQLFLQCGLSLIVL